MGLSGEAGPNDMRANVILSVLQAFCLLALVMLLLRAPAPPPAPSQSAAGASASTAAPIDEARLRRIIREEMRALAARPPAGDEAVISSPALVPPRDRVADLEQRDYVEQQLAYLTSVGEATRSDMLHLEQEIAKLNPADRREMLSRLARAINAGRINGHL